MCMVSAIRSVQVAVEQPQVLQQRNPPAAAWATSQMSSQQHQQPRHASRKPGTPPLLSQLPLLHQFMHHAVEKSGRLGQRSNTTPPPPSPLHSIPPPSPLSTGRTLLSYSPAGTNGSSWQQRQLVQQEQQQHTTGGTVKRSRRTSAGETHVMQCSGRGGG